VKRKLRLEKSIVRFSEFWCGLVQVVRRGIKNHGSVRCG